MYWKKKWHENMYQCAANHNKGRQLNFLLRFNKKKKWNTVIRSENIDFVYMLMGSYVLLSRTEIFNVIVYIFLQFAPHNLSTRKNEVANVL